MGLWRFLEGLGRERARSAKHPCVASMHCASCVMPLRRAEVLLRPLPPLLWQVVDFFLDILGVDLRVLQVPPTPSLGLQPLALCGPLRLDQAAGAHIHSCARLRFAFWLCLDPQGPQDTPIRSFACSVALLHRFFVLFAIRCPFICLMWRNRVLSRMREGVPGLWFDIIIRYLRCFHTS